MVFFFRQQDMGKSDLSRNIYGSPNFKTPIYEAEECNGLQVFWTVTRIIGWPLALIELP